MPGKIFLSLICVFWFVQDCHSQATDTLEPIQDIATILQLGGKAKDREVDFTGTVTFADPLWDQVFVQDNGKAIFVMGKLPEDLALGDKVRVRGSALEGDVNAIVAAETITKLAYGKVPDAVKIDISKLQIGEYDCLYASVEGTVLQAVSSQGHTLLYCENETVRFDVHLLGPHSLEELWTLIDAKMKFTGTVGITVSEEADESGERKIERHRISVMVEPEAIESGRSPLQTSDFGEGRDEAFVMEGQISSCFPSFFILSFGENSRKVNCNNTHSFGISNIVRVAGKNREGPTGELSLEASVIEAKFVSRIPSPFEVQKIAANDRLWKYVKVVGQPRDFELVDEKISFRVNRDDHIARVELIGQGYPNLDVLMNTRWLEARGVVTKLLPGGNCEVKVNTPADIVLLESTEPFWKYLTWILLPITGMFLVGFVWVKIQRNRANYQAASIKALHARLVSTYQAISDGLLAVDNCGEILTVNPEFCEFVGRHLEPGERLETKSCEEFLTRVKNPERVKEFIFSKGTSQPAKRTIQVEVLSPEIRSFDLCSSEIVADHGKTAGKLLMLRDRTNERKLQSELTYSNKIEAVGQLVGGIAHDFNNILTTISANLSLLSMETNENSEVWEKVKDAEVATNRGTELVRRLLSYSGKTELNPEPQSINAIIKELHQFAKATFDARYHFDFGLDSFEPFANVDSGAIEQVILNLYLNARDAMPNGGKITTLTQLIKSDDHPDLVCISVFDSGPGVPEALRTRIFDPFFSTKPGQAGAGLGLSTSKRIIEEHMGELEFEVTPEKGGCFVVRLPALLPLDNSKMTKKIVHGPEDSRNRSPHQSNLGDKRTVLVVDDEDSIRKICSVILDLHGFQVLTAASGEAALELMESEWERVDLILLDLTMPGISGLEFLEVSSQKYPKIPVVLCSGYLAGVPLELANDCPKLAKPYSAGELVNAVRDALVSKTEAHNS